MKPKMIMDYNKYKSGVDLLDQRSNAFRTYGATRRWPCVLFFDILGISAYASWVLFTIKHPETPLTLNTNR